MKNKPTISRFGDHGILIRYPQKIDRKIHFKLTQLTHFLTREYSEIIEGFTIAYHESAFYFNSEILIDETIEKLEEKLNDVNLFEEIKKKSSIFHIPVCYEAPFSLDIEEISKIKKKKVSSIIDLHTKPVYPIYFIGFSPGFPYLGGLNKKIAFPRKASPRKKVSAGSVGIAGAQTGVYPNESPGGWNIIGRSPLHFFDVKNENPSLLKAGDYVQFEAIDYAEYKQIEKQIKSGTYNKKKNIYND